MAEITAGARNRNAFFTALISGWNIITHIDKIAYDIRKIDIFQLGKTKPNHGNFMTASPEQSQFYESAPDLNRLNFSRSIIISDKNLVIFKTNPSKMFQFKAQCHGSMVDEWKCECFILIQPKDFALDCQTLHWPRNRSNRKHVRRQGRTVQRIFNGKEQAG
jgi:hypothetical protein